MSGEGAAPARPAWRTWMFAAFMLGLTALFVGLGLWQWQRLGEKEALAATVADRLDDAPVDFPPPDQWATLDPGFYNYRPVAVTGRYVPEATILVFTSLGDARGRFGGPGYWVMTPLVVEGGGTMFVNRGFVPAASRAAFAAGGGPVDTGTLMLTGTARLSEQTGSFTPGPDTANRIEWVRNIARLAAFPGVPPTAVAPVFLDLPAGAPGALPQGGETVVEFPNNHLGYALTWFGFALLTPILLIFWLRRERIAPEP